MSTENQTTENAAPDMDTLLQDPLNMSDEDMDKLMQGVTHSDTDVQADAQPAAKQQGDSDGDAPGTGTTEDAQKPDTDSQVAEDSEENAAEAPQKPAVVMSKDGKHAIPYEELRAARERATRSELMVQELTSKLEALNHEIETGNASKTRDLADIVDPETLTALREESPEVAGIIDKLIDRTRAVTAQLQSTETVAAETEREQRVRALVSVEDAIHAHPKLVYLRANDQATFSAIAQFDTALGSQSAWKDKPLTERFGAAIRAYEAAHGVIELPGATQTHSEPSVAQPLSADVGKRVQAALAKAESAAAGPSTLSDIPGGQPTASSEQDALTEMTSTALTERFMNMSTEQIEAELARLS